MRIFIISIVILILGLLDILSPIRSAFQSFTSPIQFGLKRSALELKEITRLFSKLNKIREENLALRWENQQLKGEILDIKIAKEENTILKNQLKLFQKNDLDNDYILAKIMGNPQDMTQTSAIINKGAIDGIAVGNNVILGNNLIGIISEVSPHKSALDLVISPKISITIKKLGADSNVEAIAQGDLGTQIKASRILSSEQVFVDDIFVTSGKDGKFFPNIVVGRVVEVSSESADPFKGAILNTLIDLKSMDRVFILKNN